MAVRIRLKRLGRRHRPFFRICAMDARTPRDGRVIEELGFYDPMVKEVDARAVLKGERIDYWLSMGAQPTPKVKVLIKKYGSSGTHLEAQRGALERLKQKPTAPPPKVLVPVESPAEAAEAAEGTGGAEEAQAAEPTADVVEAAETAGAAEGAESTDVKEAAGAVETTEGANEAATEAGEGAETEEETEKEAEES